MKTSKWYIFQWQWRYTFGWLFTFELVHPKIQCHKVLIEIRLGFIKNSIIIRLGFIKNHIIIRLGFIKIYYFCRRNLQS
jgi:hypothetical protein